jgi:GNAT superfamily N-acetyltransferase
VTSVVIADRPPTIDEYRRLCTAVGWDSVVNVAAAPAALASSLAACVALDADRAIGMARLVGDGAIYFYVQDVAVLPSHHGQGVGGMLLRHLMEWLSCNAPDRAFVGLFAAAGTEDFFRREGFEVHQGLVGMFRVTPIDVG